jgi:predicted nucleotidyltransferase
MAESVSDPPLRTAQQILDTLSAHSQELRRMGARKLGLFGSYRHGTPTAESDMDFLVVLARPSFDDYMTIKFFLEDLFECPVDLVIESDLKPRLSQPILSEVLYATGV